MARKKADRENFRVVVIPARAAWISLSGQPDDLITCENIAADIKRHIDDVARVDVEWDDVYSCEHCGSTWTEDSAEYNGGCCEADETANPEREAA